MKQKKNKIVFVLVMVSIILFIAVYALVTFGKDKKTDLEPNRIPMPDLDGNTVEYESKMEALEAVKQEPKTSIQQLYPDHMVDEKGYFNPDYMEFEKHRIIDSVYHAKSLVGDRPQLPIQETLTSPGAVEKDSLVGVEQSVSSHELVLDHQSFFASKPKASKTDGSTDGISLLAYVDGGQVIRDGHRLDMRLGKDVEIGGRILSGGTRIYGFVKLRPNRVLVEITQVGNHQMRLQAHDLQDGQEGIYVENHLRGEVLRTGLDETLKEINVPGVPQFGGIKRVFQRDHRSIKVDVVDQYQIILKQKS